MSAHHDVASDPLSHLDALTWDQLPARLTSEEAARVARVSKRTLMRWRARRLIRALRPHGGRLIIDRDSLRAFIEQGA